MTQAEANKNGTTFPTYNITGSTLQNSQSELGGCLFFENPEWATVSGNTFDSCYAKNDTNGGSGMGGGMYFTCAEF